MKSLEATVQAQEIPASTLNVCADITRFVALTILAIISGLPLLAVWRVLPAK
jgi:hypothetical protein